MKHPTKDIEATVGVLGCKHTTRDLIIGLSQAGLNVDQCVTIDPDLGCKQHVAGYYDLRGFCGEHGIGCTTASTYTLSSDADRDALLAAGLDIVLVTGWQRLVPDWWLDALRIGAFGMHGSFKPLPHGRGRSPMNWSLIQGRSLFYTHLFQYAPGVDDGPVVGVQPFDITPFDTCHTLHLKNTLAMVRLCAEHLPGLIDGTAPLTPQPTEGVSYFPKRSAEDGLIYFDDTTEVIYNLVRGVTRPFPGAFAYLDDDREQKVTLWRVIPFDSHLTWPGARPGEILAVFYDGSVLVKTGTTSVLVLESEGHTFTEQDVGRRLGDGGTVRRMWDNLPT